MNDDAVIENFEYQNNIVQDVQTAFPALHAESQTPMRLMIRPLNNE
jgi:hypothetical protein